MLCDSSGCNHMLDIYTNKTSTGSEKGLATTVMLSFSHDFAGKNHVLFVDNFFNGYELLLTLKNNIFACGTVNAARKNLPQLKYEKVLNRGEFDWKQCGAGITMFRWKDKRGS